MSRRSVRKRRHRTYVGTIVRATIGDVDVTKALRAVSYRQFEGTYRNPECPVPPPLTLAELAQTVEELRKLAPPEERHREALSYAWDPTGPVAKPRLLDDAFDAFKQKLAGFFGVPVASATVDPRPRGDK